MNEAVQKSKKRRRSNVVVSCNRREKLKAVSNAVWVCLKAMIEEKTKKKKRNELIKTILTIITATLLLRRF